MITRKQLLALSFTDEAIRHRGRTGRLFALWPGVYSVGRRRPSREGWWMAAVLACGEGAVLSHASAAELWGMVHPRPGSIDVSVIARRNPRRRGIRVHRRAALKAWESTSHRSIPVTAPATTLVDLAATATAHDVEAAISAADKRPLIDPERLRATLVRMTPRPGLARLRKLLDRRTFTLTDSELERRFLPIAQQVGLPLPQTQVYVNGFRVDFYWPELGLVIETDGLRYHRTAAAQTRDRTRDQTHTAAGLTPLRFTHAQVRFEPAYVEETVAVVARRLMACIR